MAIDFPSSPTNGQEFSSGSVTWTYDGTAWNLKSTTATTNDSMPIGAIMWFANTTTTPPGWLAADGTNVSRTTYAALFAVISTTYGSGDGSTTFALPNISATTGKYYVRYTTALGTTTTTSLSTAPVGTMLDWPTTSSYPTGYLRADGSAVSRTSYADLFALIGTTYGTGDGSTTFNLPNLPAAGTGSPVKIIKASLGGIVEPSTVAHAASHTEGGSDVITVTGNQIANYQTYRNVIINGSMSVAQRATSKASLNNTSSYNTADRWFWDLSSESWSWTQSVENDGPTGSGFRKSLKFTANTGDNSLLTGAYNVFSTLLEGQNLQHFAKGTSSAKKFALQFWVKASITGTFIAELVDRDNNRHVCKAFTVDAANTWEKKTYVFPADTSGVLDNDNARSLDLAFWFGAGTTYTSGTLASSWASLTSANRAVGVTNFGASNGNSFQVTGVQLEAGDVATPFEFEPIDVTLQKCYRYYWLLASGLDRTLCNATYYSAAEVYGVVHFPVTMRDKPTGDIVNGTSYYLAYRNSAADVFDNLAVAGGTICTINAAELIGSANVSGTSGDSCWLRTNNANSYVAFSAEL